MVQTYDRLELLKEMIYKNHNSTMHLEKNLCVLIDVDRQAFLECEEQKIGIRRDMNNNQFLNSLGIKNDMPYYKDTQGNIYKINSLEVKF